METVLIGHVAVGTSALVAFWTAATLRKGSRDHRRAGRIYLLSMAAILASIPPIAWALVRAGEYVQAARLPFVMLIAVAAMWVAWRAIRDRHDPARFAGPVFRILALALVLAGGALVTVGAGLGNPMTTGFGLVALDFGSAMLAFVRRGATGPHWWLGWHLNGVCLLFAATHDSFLSLGLRILLPGLEGSVMRNVIFYSVLGSAVAARIWLGRKYLGPTHRRTAPVQSRASVSISSP